MKQFSEKQACGKLYFERCKIFLQVLDFIFLLEVSNYVCIGFWCEQIPKVPPVTVLSMNFLFVYVFAMHARVLSMPFFVYSQGDRVL